MTVTTNPPKKTDLDSSLLLKPSEHVKHLVNQFNMSSHPNEINSDYPENTVSFKPESKNNKSKSLSLFHINACSLSKSFDNPQYLLSSRNKKFSFR